MTTTAYTIRPATAADAGTIKQIVRANPLDPNAVDWHYFLVLELIEAGKPIIASIGMVHPAGDPKPKAVSYRSLTAWRPCRSIDGAATPKPSFAP